jgi:hypothetical protein
MALARIITRSQACARELSQDLLARGYAVEVVSPDELPERIADLELRVETSDGGTLTANVKVQHGERSTSLDFVHHLRTPVAEVSSPEWPPNVLRTNRAPHFALAVRDEEGSKLPEKIPSPAAKPDLVCAEIPLKPVPDAGFVSKAAGETPERAALVLRQPKKVAVASSTVRRATGRGASPHRWSNRSQRWFWRASLGFAGVMLLALVAGVGTTRKPLASAAGEITGTTQAPVTAASGDVVLWNFTGPAENTAHDSGAEGSLEMRSEVKGDRERNKMAQQNPGPATRGLASEATGKSVHDLVARDTVVYLDEHYKPAPKTEPTTQLAGRQPGSRKHGGVIAANSVTALNDKPTPKPK